MDSPTRKRMAPTTTKTALMPRATSAYALTLIGGRTFRRIHPTGSGLVPGKGVPSRYCTAEFVKDQICQANAERVVTTMKTPGMREYLDGARTFARWIVINMIASPARSWFAPPK